MAAAMAGPTPRDQPPQHPSPGSSTAAPDSSPDSMEMERFSPNSASKTEGKISVRRLPPPCWTEEETDALIKIYREKWFALRRGNLRATHWDEVADAVKARCRHLYGGSGSHSPKTAVQCRHKMEKLRKRYRSEKKRPHRNSWVHFPEMEAMEMGTGPPRRKEGSSSEENDRGESDEEDDDDEERNRGYGRKKGVKSSSDLRFQISKAARTKISTPRVNEWSIPRVRNAGLKGKPAALMEVRKEMEERERKEREATVFDEIAAAVKTLGDGFLRVEEMKMEMAKEMEKMRMEMELKRTEMLLESQRWIVDVFLQGISPAKKKKKLGISQNSL